MSAITLSPPEVEQATDTVPKPGRADAFRLRTALPALLLLAVAAVLVIWGIRRGEQPAPHVDVTALPTAFGSWRMVASETTDAQLAFTPEVAKALDLDSFTQRKYVDARTGREIYLLLEYRRQGRGAFNHRPEACYPAAGIALSGRKIVPVDYGGTPQKAVYWVGDYSGSEGVSHQALIYWFATGNRTETSFWKQQVQMALGRLHPDENGWVFARLVCYTTPGDEAGALAAEQDFVRQSSPAMIQILNAGRR